MIFKTAIDHQQATSSTVHKILRIIINLAKHNIEFSGILFDYGYKVIEIIYNLNLITTQLVSIFSISMDTQEIR
ncbi:hypothetical protein [Coxiella endosymbiont of Ornithodoros amblus]|uniref:hypothetical protein n=1 Tax=Coxiella endosymbiont of Ornithodoros amblus TaxID=1656166 RepID=UPI00244D9BF8|nr:hypothetical protein [Coxiella endosymbiont of Ornithodoros amblus]